MKQKLTLIFGTIVLVVMMFGCPNEQSINQVNVVAEMSSHRLPILQSI